MEGSVNKHLIAKLAVSWARELADRASVPNGFSDHVHWPKAAKAIPAEHRVDELTVWLYDLVETWSATRPLVTIPNDPWPPKWSLEHFGLLLTRFVRETQIVAATHETQRFAIPQDFVPLAEEMVESWLETAEWFSVKGHLTGLLTNDQYQALLELQAHLMEMFQHLDDPTMWREPEYWNHPAWQAARAKAQKLLACFLQEP